MFVRFILVVKMMKNEALDICLNSAMMSWTNDEDDLLPDELANIESKFSYLQKCEIDGYGLVSPEFDCLISSIMNDCKQEKEEAFSIDEFLFDSSLDALQSKRRNSHRK